MIFGGILLRQVPHCQELLWAIARRRNIFAGARKKTRAAHQYDAESVFFSN